MTRLEFTSNITQLLFDMIMEGEFPLIDYVKRSAEEQNRLYKAGKSKCDGYRVKSKHQSGKAMDIYFQKKGLKNLYLGGDGIPKQIIKGFTQEEVNKNSIAKKINPVNLQISALQELDWSKPLYEKWHKHWEELGGKPMLSWDLSHFEI